MTELIYANLTYGVRGALYDIFNELHYLGLSEEGWESALMIGLQGRNIAAARQVEYQLLYKGYRIGRFFVDVVVEDKLALELKAIIKLRPIDIAQLLTYLNVSSLKLGLLVNLGGDELEIERIPNFINQHKTDLPTVAENSSLQQWLYPELTAQLRAILYEIHQVLGPGFMHMHYRRAARLELHWHDIPYHVKKEITLAFRQQPIETRETRLIIVDQKILLVPIAIKKITPRLKGRFRQYLKLLDLKLGLIANFHAAPLEIETIRI